MFTLKNVSGVEVEVRHLAFGPKFVKANESMDVEDHKLQNETDDAYVTVRTVKNLKGKSDEGALIWEDEEVLTAWPKAHWEKVTRKTQSNEDKKETEK